MKRILLISLFFIGKLFAQTDTCAFKFCPNTFSTNDAKIIATEIRKGSLRPVHGTVTVTGGGTSLRQSTQDSINKALYNAGLLNTYLPSMNTRLALIYGKLYTADNNSVAYWDSLAAKRLYASDASPLFTPSAANLLNYQVQQTRNDINSVFGNGAGSTIFTNISDLGGNSLLKTADDISIAKYDSSIFDNLNTHLTNIDNNLLKDASGKSVFRDSNSGVSTQKNINGTSVFKTADNKSIAKYDSTISAKLAGTLTVSTTGTTSISGTVTTIPSGTTTVSGTVTATPSGTTTITITPTTLTVTDSVFSSSGLHTIATGARCIFVVNTGTATATFNGVNLVAGQSKNFPPALGVLWPQMTCNALTSTLNVTVSR